MPEPVPVIDATGIGPYETRRAMLADGRRGTVQTIQLIQQLVNEGLEDTRVRRKATDVLIAYEVPSRDKWGEISALSDDTLRNFFFRDDPVDREMLQPAAAYLENLSGDCDCINAVYFPALAGSVGFSVGLVTIKADPEHPDDFSHIYCEVWVPNGSGDLSQGGQDGDSQGGEWIPFDFARDNPGLGKVPPGYWGIERWPLTGLSLTDPRFNQNSRLDVQPAAAPQPSNPGYLQGYYTQRAGLGAAHGPAETPGRYFPGPGRARRIAAVKRRLSSYYIDPRGTGFRGMGKLADSSTDLLNVGALQDSSASDYVPPDYSASSGPSMLDTILAATPSILNSTATLVKSANTPGLPYYPGQSPGTAFGSVSVGSSNGLIWVLLFGGAAVLLLGRR